MPSVVYSNDYPAPPQPNIAPGSPADVMNSRSLSGGHAGAAATLSFPSEAIAYGTTFRFVQYSYANQQTNAKFIQSTAGAQIFLPLPGTLQMNQGITYEGVDAGVLGFGIKAGASAVAGLIREARSGNTDIATAAGKTIGTVANALGSSVEYVLRKAAGEALTGAESQIDQMTGTVTNPYNVATFRHSDPRTFQLSFMLIPRTAEESRTIKHICDTFVWHSLPYRSKNSVQGATIGNQSMFLDMPDEVEIAFFGSNSLFQFARAVISTVNVNYAPFGTPSFFTDSTPTAVELQLGIQEIQQLTRDAFSKDGYVEGQTGTPFDDTNVDTGSVFNIGNGFGPPPEANTAS